MIRGVLTLIFSLLFVAGASAQGLKDVRINEVLVKNSTNFVDDYGNRSSWFELVNTGHARIKLAGCILRATMQDGSVVDYEIPSTDSHAELGPVEYKVFYCSGEDHKGTFFTNFTLDNIASIALYATGAEGDPIDHVEVDIKTQKADVSVGYKTVNDKVVFGVLSHVTPGASNVTEVVIPKSVKILEVDPNGGYMTMTAVLVVFTVLVMLFFLFKLLGIYMITLAKKKERKILRAKESKKTTSLSSTLDGIDTPDYSGEEIAAISMALSRYFKELSKKETALLTINRVARSYSPWSSKIHGLRQLPKR